MTTETKGMPKLVSAAIEEINQHYAEIYGVAELADELAVSKCHLIRVFSAAVGTPPGRYLKAVRIAAAKHYLLERALQLEVIAGLCGFSCAGYFCKVFKASTGESPVCWQKKALASKRAALETDELDEQLFL